KITGVTKAIDMANNAVTVNGTRSKRLDLISSRLMDQTATFQELQSENEDVDLAEAGTMLAMARLTYEASLNATGKIMTTSLMDYI
ncbi:MAG: flagellar hook-associated protein 3, partial [Butyrivibrio sp.]|nr:flagellar hook-associated protein 3 [Butyrivibrio sp.]